MATHRSTGGTAIILLCIVLALPWASSAASLHPGSVDASFAPQRVVADSSSVRPILIEPDGDVIVGGSFVEVDGVVRRGIARFKPDGSRDDSFGTGIGVEGEVTSIVRMPDGKLLIGGKFEVVEGAPRRNLARLHPDGTLDTTFSIDHGGPNWVHCLHAPPDGSALVSESPDRLRRLRPDGTTDESFTPTHSGVIWAIASQPDGRILIAGYFWTVNGIEVHSLARLNADGSLDTSFVGPGLGGPVDIWDLTLLPDGKILICGNFTSLGAIQRRGIARLNADGTADLTFDPGSGTDNVVESLAVQADGRVLIGGGFSWVNGVARMGIARLEPDGALDTTFDPGSAARNSVRGLAVQLDGQILAGIAVGQDTPGPALIRLEGTGAVDPSFDPDLKDAGVLEAVVVQPDGRIVVGGYFGAVGGVERVSIARVNTDGSLDESFDPGIGAGPNYVVHAVALQPDGRMVIGGEFWWFAGSYRHWVARLEADGTLDTGFNTGPGPNAPVRAIALQGDGKVLIGGDFTTVDYVARARVARLAVDGSLDQSFDPGDDPDGRVERVEVRPDGRILIAGWFTRVGKEPRRGVARLEADGSLDSTFDASIVDGYIEDLVILPDGKILIAGLFTIQGGPPWQGIARLNEDGSADTSFDAPDTDNTIKTVALSPDGRPIIGGYFTRLEGLPHNALARLAADGTLDAEFGPAMRMNEGVHAIGFGTDGRVLVAGRFTNVGGVVCFGLARLHGIVQTLSVVKSGNGQGTVTADSGAIDCGAVCRDTYGNGDLVTLSASAGPGFAFAGWSGEGCSGTGTCQVVMDQARTVSAEFRSIGGADTPGIYRESDRQWYLKNTNAPGAADLEFPYGDPSDQAVKGDWDGNGTDTVGIYRDGTFYLRNSNSAGPGEIVFLFGAAGDIPIAGDWDGDGIDTVGVYRPATAEWYLRNTNAQGEPDLSFTYGLADETPVVGDWDGDGIDTVGIFRASDRQWYLHNSNVGGNAELVFPYGDPAQDVPVVGDWDGDGDDTVGIYRAALGEWFLKNTNEAGNADLNFVYGLVNEKPLAGDWDGN